MASQGGEERSQDDFFEAKEAVVCPDAQLLGLLQELGEKCPQTGHFGVKQPLLCRIPR